MPLLRHRSMLASGLCPVLEKHNYRLGELRGLYDRSNASLETVERKLRELTNGTENCQSLLSESEQDYIERAVAQKRRPVVIFMGQRNCGKSSLLNEVLRKSCMPTDEHPCTARIVRVTHGSQSKARLLGPDGELEEVECRNNRIPKHMVNLSTEKRKDYWEVKKQVVAELNVPVLASGVDFIDSPGFGESHIIDKMLEEFILDDIEPVVVYVINGNQMLTEADLITINHLHRNFPSIPIIFVLNKTDIDMEAIEQNIHDLSCYEEREEALVEAVVNQKRLLQERIASVFERLKKPIDENDSTSFLPADAKLGECTNFHTVSALKFRGARLKRSSLSEDDWQFVESFNKFEVALVMVVNESLRIMDEKLVENITRYLEGMLKVMSRAQSGIRDAVYKLPHLIKSSKEAEGKMKACMISFIDKHLRSKQLIEDAIKVCFFRITLVFLWEQIKSCNPESLYFISYNEDAQNLLDHFNLKQEDLSSIIPGSPLQKKLKKVWFALEARDMTVSKLSEMIGSFIRDRLKNESSELLEELLGYQKSLQDPYMKLLLNRVYAGQDAKSGKRVIRKAVDKNSFSRMVITTAAYGVHNAISKGITHGVEVEAKKLFGGKNLNDIFPSELAVKLGKKSWGERFAENLEKYLCKNSERISKLICEKAVGELDVMHAMFIAQVDRLERVTRDFNSQGKEELQDIQESYRKELCLLVLRAHAFKFHHSKGLATPGEKIGVGDNGRVYRCGDDTCAWCFEAAGEGRGKRVAIREVDLDLMKEDRKARFARDLTYTVGLAEDVQDSPYLVRFYGLVMPSPTKVHVIMEQLDKDLLSWLQTQRHKVTELLRVALDVALGVQVIHKRNMVFLDVKPSNVLISREGRAKLNYCKPESAMSLTPLGCPFHLHKEVYSAYDTGACQIYFDIYAFGMLLWVLYEGTGRLSPFHDCRSHEEIRSLLEQGATPRKPRGTPDRSWELMQNCWKIPEQMKIDDVIAELENELRSALD